MMESLATDLKGTPIGASVFFPGPVQTSLGITTNETRPAHLRNEPGEAPPLVGQGRGPRPQFDPNIFMSPEEVGRRVLRAIRRGDLFIMSHPEFRDGIIARNEALLRAIPDEPPNHARHEVIKQFGTLCYNPIYDGQQRVPGLD
jgi:short-subunit dehydrogenase